MLLINALFSLAIGFMEEGLKYGCVAIAFAVLLMLAVSSITSFWRHRKMMNKPTKRNGKEVKFVVKRGEKSQSVDLALTVSDIVVGDMVCLNPHP